MNRLQSELHRLYLTHSVAGTVTDAAACSLIDDHGSVRALVLELARPANWDALAKVWRGVQAELELPAPAIAVSGTDGFQLWFSLAEPISVGQAHSFLLSLRSRFLPDMAAKRLSLWPAVDTTAPHPARHAPMVPAEQAHSGNWSAFVAPDLAPVFADTPWLDIPPSHDGQADLLCRLESIKPAAFEAACALLAPAPAPPVASAAQPASSAASPPPMQAAASAESREARRFLLRVMNDDTVALALRIEAAKALLPCCDEHRPSQDH